MKKVVLTVSLVLVFSCVFSVFAYADFNYSDDLALLENDNAKVLPEKYSDDFDYSNFCGRLFLPYAGVDVALYNSYEQYVCNRQDSACFFNYESYDGYIIADHNTQEFSTLIYATPGEIGEIALADGSVQFIMCVSSFPGHNTEYAITDSNWNNVLGQYDITMYTCLDRWDNVQVCQWVYIDDDEVINADFQSALAVLQGLR